MVQCKNRIILAIFTKTESLWNTLLNDYKVKINFAYNTFKWESEASQKAAVFCVIIGFSLTDKKEKSCGCGGNHEADPAEGMGGMY